MGGRTGRGDRGTAMNDWFDASLRFQKQILDAQRRTLEAGSQAVGAGDALVQVQEATRKAAEANLAAFQAWARLWGAGPW
ncbi:hypothetical protein D9601_14485 [Sphingomonas sp. MA1305]|nr:hypothetical protein [Sphingomonas sp. MA1305]